MVIITGTIKFSTQAELEKVKSALVRRAERSRGDPGNIDYAFAQNLEDPTEIRLTERWESEALLQAHLEIPDEEFNAVLKTAKIERAIVLAHDAGNERELMKR